MNFYDEIDHEEHAAVRREIDEENAAELAAETADPEWWDHAPVARPITSPYVHPMLGSSSDRDLTRLICRDCSTRNTVVMFPADEKDAHDRFHNDVAAEDPKIHPILCAYCQRQSDPEVAYYGPNGFTLCDDCAREVQEEFGE